MKIISAPDFSDWIKECSCDLCSTRLEITLADVKYKVTKKWYQDYHNNGGYYANVDTYYVMCPTCESVIDVHTGDIPLLIQKRMKK